MVGRSVGRRGVGRRRAESEGGRRMDGNFYFFLEPPQFDSKILFTHQVVLTIEKANKAPHGIQLIKKIFNNIELQLLTTSNYYSILCYFMYLFFVM